MTLHFREYLGQALTLKIKKLATKLMEEEQGLNEALHQRQLGIAAAATAALAQLGHKKICKVILEDFQCSNRLGLGAPSRPGKIRFIYSTWAFVMTLWKVSRDPAVVAEWLEK